MKALLGTEKQEQLRMGERKTTSNRWKIQRAYDFALVEKIETGG